MGHEAGQHRTGGEVRPAPRGSFELRPAGLDSVFGALADPTRRWILGRLAHRDSTVSELAEPLEMSLPGVTKHLAVLERAGLIESRKRGRSRTCRLRAAPLSDARDWLDRYRAFWEGQLESLAAYLEEERDPA